MRGSGRDRDEVGDDARTSSDADADARALASTLRLRILRLCLDEPMTNREIAERLDRNPATILHHVRTLADRGFLAAQPVRRGTRGLARGALPGHAQVVADAGRPESCAHPHRHVPRGGRAGRPGRRAWPRGSACGSTTPGTRSWPTRLHAVFEDFAGRPPTPGGVPYSLFFALHEDVTQRPEEASAGQ